MKKWRTLQWFDECPSCGDGVESLTEESTENGHAYDGDECRCPECGHPGCVSADEDSSRVIWHDVPTCDCHWCEAASTVDALREQVKRLQAEVAAWRDWLKNCQTIPLAACECEDVPRGQNVIKARCAVDLHHDLD